MNLMLCAAFVCVVSQMEPKQMTYRMISEDRFGAVVCFDEPGPGGASHEYAVLMPDSECSLHVKFQNGPLDEVAINGTTHEHMLSILIDRMRSFQNGRFACDENAKALAKLEEALNWLNHRTENREARGVEGTHEI